VGSIQIQPEARLSCGEFVGAGAALNDSDTREPFDKATELKGDRLATGRLLAIFSPVFEVTPLILVR
jgi:hypothetical protein